MVRLSVGHKLFFVLLAAGALAVGGTLLVFILSLEKGFVEYVETRQQERIDVLRTELAQIYSAENSWEGLMDDKHRWGRLLSEGRDPGPQQRWRGRARPPPTWRRGFDGRPPPRPPRPFGAENRRRPPPPEYEEDTRTWPPPRPRGVVSDPLPLEPLSRRLMLLDAQGNLIFGREQLLDRVTRYPIELDGETVGYLGVLPGAMLEDIGDTRFLERQTHAVELIALGMVLLSAALAIPMARRMNRPLRALTTGSRELARGNYGTRVPVESSDELGDLARDFNDLARALERTERMRREWVASISHELRTPLSVLSGELEALQDGVRPFGRESADSLYGDVQRLHRLVDDLYELSMSELENRLDEPCTMNADPDRLSQLFSNLLKNGLRCTDSGVRLRISIHRRDSALSIDLQDSAPGVAEADMPRLFERFFRAEASRNRAHGGVGLGLAICRNIVEAHEGRISAQASPMGGLWIRLELREGTDQ